jgi:hypothetical protein
MITDRDDEFRRTITALYREELGRDPDPEGMAAHLHFAREGATGEQIRQALHDSAEGVAHRAAPPPAPEPLPRAFPPLAIQQGDFVDQEGRRRVLCGTDQFCAYRLFLDQRHEDLAVLIDESVELGFDCWRVFGMGSQRQNKILELNPQEPGYYEGLRAFAELLNLHGIVPLFTVFVDAQDIMPGGLGHHDHWHRVADELRGTETILSGGNQYPKNGFDPFALADPGMIWSRGSSTADPPVFEPKPHGASVCEFHPRRDYPAMMMDTVASAVTIQTRDRVLEPLIISEPIGCSLEVKDGRAKNPRLFWRLARHYATECAGAVFHNDYGMRGQLMPEEIRDCAVGWVDGMTL